MRRQIEIQVKLPFRLAREGDAWVAWCWPLDVTSHGRDEQEAEQHLREAVMLFLETCAEFGTLAQMLREQGFTIGNVGHHAEHKPDEHWLDVPMDLIAAGGSGAPNHPC
jgi:predicted RNase H-like HicB family nuclease